ncbi:MAG: hypothetical protein J6Y78_11185 [Paludibacteraceae bacterium]|nr:hypothetical protein [Paludibacteraceae bacterium]
MKPRKDYKESHSIRDYVYHSGNGKYQITKGKTYFGRYNSREDAKKVSDELKKLGWDKNNLKKAQENANVKPCSHLNRNTVGYLRVTKQKDNRIKQGFTYVYSYRKNGKEKRLYGKTIKGLEKKVRKEGLEWEKLS